MTEYRLFDGVDGPAEQISDSSDYTFGVEFYVDDSAWATKIWFWASTALGGTFTGALFAVDGTGLTGQQVTGSEVTFDTITAGWNSADLDSGVTLTVGQRYRAAVLVTTANGFTATPGYWVAGGPHPGASGRSNNLLHAPNRTDALGNVQGSYHQGSTLTFPDTADGGHYWVDVSVSDVDLDALNVSLYAVDPDDGTLTPLPHAVNITIGQYRNSIGKVTVDYPFYGRNFDVLAGNVDDDRDLEVEIWTTGKRSGALRALLTDTAGDDTAEDAVWRFEGWDLNVLLDEVLVWPQTGAAEQELIVSTDTAGEVISTIVTQAQARGGLAGVTLGFTTAVDSAGAAWASVVTATFSPQATLLDVLQEFIEIGLVGGFTLTAGRELRMWNPDGQGVDRTTGPRPVIFRRGQAVTESPRRHTVRNSGTTVLAAGAENLYQSATDTTALARRGRRIEVAGSANSLTTSGSVLAYAQTMLTTVTPGTHEVTHGILFGAGHPRPLVDYQLADHVWSDTRGALERLHIEQLEITYGAGGYAGTVVLNTPIVDRVAAIARKLKRMSSGTAVVGTSPVAPPVDDGKAPAQVLGVTATSASYVANSGVTMAAVQAGWTAVTTNADASEAEDIAGYFPSYRYVTGALPTAWVTLPQVSGTVTDWDGVVAGAGIQVRVACVDQWGRLGAWSDPFSLVAGSDITPPPTPSTPVVESYLGILTVAWDGLGSVGEGMPVDFDRVEVHVSTTSGFTPNASTLIDSLRAKGVFPWADGSYGVTYFAKLVAYDKTGNASAASGQDSALLSPAGDGDIGGLSIGKLTAGIMSAIMTISGIIRTASSGDRVEIDAAGIRCYDGTTPVFEFNIATGQVNIIGTLQTGTGSDVIRVQPSSTTGRPEIYMNGLGDAFTPAYLNAVPVGGINLTGLNSGSFPASGSMNNAVQGTVKLSPTSVELFVNSAPGNSADVNKRRGGYFSGTQTYARMGVTYSTTEDERSELLCNGDDIRGKALDSVVLRVENAAGTTNGGYLNLQSGTNNNSYIGKFVPGFVDAYLRFGDGGFGGTTVLNAGDNTFIRLNPGGNLEFFENGFGYSSLANLKSFVIDHPTDPDRLLVHVCTESPVAGVEYTGTAEVRGGQAEVVLPDYFEALCEDDGRTVQLTPVGELCLVAATPIVDGRFTVKCSGPDGTQVAWLVKATRRNAPFDPEPLRSDVTVGGSGPYRYIVPEGN